MTTVSKRLPASIWLAVLVASTLATAVAAIVGVKDVAGALATIGWRGLGALVLATPVPMLLLGGAWFLLAPRENSSRLDVFVWSRLVRDAAGELLPFSPVGGFFIGARAAVLRGLSPGTVISTSVVDATTELLAQLGFTALGLGLLVTRLGAGSVRSGLVVGVVAGLGLSALGAVLFIILQRRGSHLVERIAERVIPGAAAAAGDLGAAITATYARPARVVLAASTHFAAWTASGLGVWLALHVAGVNITPASVLAIESLVAAARSAVVVAPMGLGVQEATYALVGPLFGLGPETALALSIIKRARDLVVGAPALMSWQAMEGMRVMGRREAPRPATPLGSEAPASAKG